jgi:hypothetical protein
VSHRAVFGDDVDEEELLEDVEAEKRSDPSSEDDSEGPDQVTRKEMIFLCRHQGDQIGRIFANWVTVFVGLFYENYRSRPFWGLLFPL